MIFTEPVPVGSMTWSRLEIRQARQIHLKPILQQLGYRLLPRPDANFAVTGLAHEIIIKDVGTTQVKRIAAFGDGPVEIREMKKRGGLAIGIASDEVRRFDLNQAKRRRLIRAGADFIIPDFSQGQPLLELMGLH